MDSPSTPSENTSPVPQPSQPDQRVSPLRIVGGFLSISVVVILIMTASLVLIVEPRLNHISAMPSTQIASTSGTNWLLVGSDSRVGLSPEEIARLGTGKDVGAGERTDTIILAHVPRYGGATLISIPRDSYVEIPGHGKDKINAAFAYGGSELLISTVEKATGLHIDHYAEVGMGGVAQFVDTLGGVNICLDEDIQDKKAKLNLEAGCQTLDGPTALGYVRTRATAMGDLDRVVRQREFFKTLLDQTLSAQVLLSPRKATALADQASESLMVSDGVHSWDLGRLGFALLLGVESETVPFGGFEDTDVGNVVLWDKSASEALFDSLR